MKELVLRAAFTATLPLLPIALLQGRRVRARLAPARPAAGPTSGTVPGAGPTLSLVIFGESTVAGVGAPTHTEALSGRLAAALAARTGRGVAWRAVGRSGATAAEARWALTDELVGSEATVAVVVFGVNDVVRLTRSWRWTADLADVVTLLRQHLGAIPVVLAGVPPIGHFPALPQPLRAMLGLRGRLLCLRAAKWADRMSNIVHVPTTFEELGLVSTDRGNFTDDGIHPSVKAYAAWGARLAREIEQLLHRG
ncbi:MAG: SGNH/GDSL hydrolase family protein [Acidobacteriota bacterium]|nr:MAG: SGNH/GDSL hydrolase family protein [Acidobacteriota bacterium]